MKILVIAVGLTLLAFSVNAEPAAPSTPGSPPVGAQGATAAATPAAKAVVAKPPKPPKPKLICEETKSLGSMMTSEICATQAEWDARRRHDTAEVDRLHDFLGGNGGSGP